MTGWRLSVVVTLGTALLRVLARTWRVRVIGEEHVSTLRGRGGVLAFWHGEIVPTMALFGALPVHAIISQSDDGELIARVAARFGAFSVRGSSSRGGAEALVQAVRLAREGRIVGVTPDGPRGPRHAMAPGTATIARRAGVPVMPLRWHAERAWVARSWDRFTVPKPFARVTCVVGPPVAVRPDEPVDVATVRLVEAMAAAGRLAGAPD